MTFDDTKRLMRQKASLTFTPGSAIYNHKGEKLGWVDMVLENIPEIGSQRAIVHTMGNEKVSFITKDLRDGTIYNKVGLRERNIPRSTPVIVNCGARLFRRPDNVFLGHVVRVFVPPSAPAQFQCWTNLNNIVHAERFIKGEIKIGARDHAEAPTPVTE